MSQLKIKTVLGFDYGIKRIGVAVGQTITLTANPLVCIAAKQGIPDWNQLELLIRKWKPDALVVGIPLHMDDTESEMATKARKFANQMHGRLHLPVFHVDERLSSQEAKVWAKNCGHKGNYKTNPIDSLAANILLESWLNDPKTQELFS